MYSNANKYNYSIYQSTVQQKQLIENHRITNTIHTTQMKISSLTTIQG